MPRPPRRSAVPSAPGASRSGVAGRDDRGVNTAACRGHRPRRYVTSGGRRGGAPTGRPPIGVATTRTTNARAHPLPPPQPQPSVLLFLFLPLRCTLLRAAAASDSRAEPRRACTASYARARANRRERMRENARLPCGPVGPRDANSARSDRRRGDLAGVASERRAVGVADVIASQKLLGDATDLYSSSKYAEYNKQTPDYNSFLISKKSTSPYIPIYIIRIPKIISQA